jgi:hypothetical protein
MSVTPLQISTMLYCLVDLLAFLLHCWTLYYLTKLLALALLQAVNML